MQPRGFKGWACACGKAHSRAPASSPAEAAARQEPPPKCVVVYAEGVAEALERSRGSLETVHQLASDGCCGFVALRAQPLALAVEDNAVSASNVAQLLGATAVGTAALAERFRGLRVAVVSDVASVHAVAAAAGACTPELQADGGVDTLAAHLLRLLALSDNYYAPLQNAAPVCDLILLHMRPRGAAPWQQQDADAAAVALDGLLRALLACPDVKQQLYVLLLLGRNEPGGAEAAYARLPPHLAHLRPKQSFATRPDADAAEEHALLCVHSLSGVVRRDGAAFVAAAEFRARGARGTIAADDVLAELAYKLGRAPKYGA